MNWRLETIQAQAAAAVAKPTVLMVDTPVGQTSSASTTNDWVHNIDQKHQFYVYHGWICPPHLFPLVPAFLERNFVIDKESEIGGTKPAEVNGADVPFSFDIAIRIASGQDLGLEVQCNECDHLLVKRILTATGAIGCWNLQMMYRSSRGDVWAYRRIVREGDVLARVNASASAEHMIGELLRCEREGILARIHVLRRSLSFECGRMLPH